MRRIGTRLPLALLSLLLTLSFSAPLFAATAKTGAKRGGKAAANAPRKNTPARKQAAERAAVTGELLPAAQAGLERRNDIKGRSKKFSARNNRAQAAATRVAKGDTSVRFDQPAAAAEWFLKKRLPKGEKVLPVERYFQAKEKIKKMRRHSSAKGRNLPSQEESGEADADLSGLEGEFPNGTGGGGAGDGSASTSGALGTWQPLGPGNVGGRTRALIIHPTNPDVMYAAAVAGGVWKTTNAGASWAPLDDFLANIAVTSMAMDPSDPDTIYAGTGEGFFNADGVRGAGVFKTADAGATWTRLAFTANNVNFHYVNDVVVSPASPQHVYAATRTGVWRSLDGGQNWTQVLASNAANGINGAMDLVIRTDQTTDYLFASVGTFAQARIFRNTDAGGGGVWEMVHTEAAMGRTTLALAPSNQNTVYALASSIVNGGIAGRDYTHGLHAVFRSNASGDAGTWTARVRNTDANKLNTALLSNTVNAFNSAPQCGGGADVWLNQGWYDNIIAVDPTDENVVWAGGVDLFRSDDGGANWGMASHWWFTGNGVYPNSNLIQYAHADQHLIVFHPNYDGSSNQTMYASNDGGIFRTNNARSNVTTTTAGVCGFAYQAGANSTVASPVTWQSVNNGYAVTQFFHGLPYPNGTTYFGGTQDNGTNRGTDAAGPNGWARIFGGDGGYVAVNPNLNASGFNNIFAETTNLSIRRSTNGGASFSFVTSGIVTTGATGDVFPFITTFVMDPTNPNRLWIGGRWMWRTDTANAATAAGVTWTRASAQITGGSITAIAVSPTNPNRVINGAASGQLRFTTAGSTSTGTTTWTQAFTPRGNGFGTVSWLAFDPTDEMVVYATFSTFNSATSGNGFGHVFRSTNGGSTWTLIDGNQTPGNPNAIPDIPVHSIVVDPNNTSRLYVGTDLGVFVSLDGGANWARETSGFSNVPVESLSVQNNGGVTSIFAFTHGRGVFKVTIPASCANVSPTTQQFYSPGNAGSVAVTKSLAATGACTWNAVSNSDFITINSGAGGEGNGTVGFTVAPNTTGAPRTGTLTVAGQTVNINQDAAPVATTDVASTDEDTPVDINVLANDTDADGDTLSVVSVTQGANGAVSVNPDKTVRYAPAQDFNGSDSFSYTIDDGHGGQSTANVEVTVNAVNDAPVISVSLPTQNVQYSDAVTPVQITVSDVDDATSALTLELTSALPAGLQSSSDAPGSLTIAGHALAAAGTYDVGVKATDASNSSTTSNVQFVVAKETTETVYIGDTAVVTAGPNVQTATFRLGAHLNQEADGAAGDITLARVTFELFKSNNMSDTPDRVVSGVAVNAAGDTLPATVDNMAADTYVVKVKVDAGNGYWTASPVGMATVNVTVGSNDQRANGGGWVADAGSANGKSNFGFTVRNEKGTPKGNFVYVFRGADGFTYVVKNNTWQGGFLNFAGEAGTSALTRAAFKGRCNVQKVDPATGLTVQSWGNFSFTVDVRDGDLLNPRQADGFAITIQDNGGGVWRQVGTSAALLPLGGGNVQVKGK